MAHFSNDGGLFQEKKRSILDRKMAIERLILLGEERDHSRFYIFGERGQRMIMVLLSLVVRPHVCSDGNGQTRGLEGGCNVILLQGKEIRKGHGRLVMLQSW